MCNFCEVELGGIKNFEKHEYKTMSGDKVCFEEDYSVSLYMMEKGNDRDNCTPDPTIVAEHWLNNEVVRDAIEIKIKYCPFCGRKIRND